MKMKRRVDKWVIFLRLLLILSDFAILYFAYKGIVKFGWYTPVWGMSGEELRWWAVMVLCIVLNRTYAHILKRVEKQRESQYKFR